MASILDLMGHVQQQGEIGRQRGTESRLARLAGQAYAAPRDQRDSFVQQAIETSPQAGFALQSQLQKGDDRDFSELAKVASILSSVPNEQKADYYAANIAPVARRHGFPVPLTYDASFQPALDKIASMAGMGKRNDNKVIGNALVDPSGRVVYQGEEQPVNGQYVDVPDGKGGMVKMIFDPRTRQFTKPQFPGQDAAPSQGQPTTFMGPDGMPVDMSGVTDPNVRASIMQNPGAWGAAPNGSSAQLPDRNVGGGGLGYTPPKAQGEQFQTLTPQEVAGLGLPSGTIAQRSPTGQVQIINKPRDLPTGGQVIDNGDGTTTYIPAGKITEGERNAAGFYDRMIAANEEMKRLEAAGYDPTNRRDYYTAGGEVLNPLATPEGQQYQQAKANWVRANLRKESGAAIGVAEMDQEIKNYFPIPGDSPEVIAQKARNRTVTERAMRQAAGGGLAPPPQAAPQQQATAASGGWSIQRVD